MTTKWICLWALPHYVLSLQKETSFCYVTTQMRATELYKLYTTLWCCLFYLFFSKKKQQQQKQMKLWPFQWKLLSNTGRFGDIVVNASADNGMGVSSNILLKKVLSVELKQQLFKQKNCCMRRWLDKNRHNGCTKETNMLLTISPSPNIENLPLSCML